MIRYLSYDAAGRIMADAPAADDLAPGTAQLSVESPPLGVGLSHYVANGQLVSKGTPPSPYHVFNYTSKQWDDPRTPATEWPLVRIKRDTLLSDTDWIVTKAMETGTAVPTPWKTYRQALRDITTQTDPFNLVWPVLPL